MSQLSKNLKEWQAKGLLSESQLQSILAFEAAKPKIRWGQIGFLILGVATIVLGIISIVASNWHLISPSVKLTSGFAILTGIAALIYKLQDKQSVLVTDGLKAFLALYCFAMIGLIAQVYNLHGDSYRTGLLWSAMTVLLVIDAKNFLLPMFWLVIFGASFLTGLIEHPIAQKYLVNPPALYVLIFTIILLGLKRLKTKSPFTFSVEWFTVFVWLLGLAAISIDINKADIKEYYFQNYIAEYCLSIIIGVALWMEDSLKKAEKVAFIVGLLFANIVLSFNYAAQTSATPLILGSIVCLLAWAFYALSREKSRLFNAVLVIMGFKVFEIFIRQFKSLLQTGVGLIASGAAVLLTIYFWSKNRQKIEARLQELVR